MTKRNGNRSVVAGVLHSTTAEKLSSHALGFVSGCTDGPGGYAVLVGCAIWSG